MSDLDVLSPKLYGFKLEHTGKTYELRRPSLQDQLWMNRRYGENLTQILTSGDVEETCRVVFRLMKEEDKKDFLQKPVTLIDDEGCQIDKLMGGGELLYRMLQKRSEIREMVEAFTATMTAKVKEDPELRDLARQAEENLKAENDKQKKAEKKTRAGSTLSGAKSSIHSPTNTVGQPSIS